MVDVDDTYAEGVTSLVKAGFASLLAVSIPASAKSGDALKNCQAYIYNSGQSSARMYVYVIDRDTGKAVDIYDANVTAKLSTSPKAYTSDAVPVGSDRIIYFGLIMPNKDFKWRVIAGHVE